jgi:beta-glucosidase/6-phospho-beta-glucosidase/beta-galactosidase
MMSDFTPQERQNLINMYISQYNQTNLHIERLFNTLDDIRNNINNLIGNNAYLISTNLKNYAKEPSLNRKWNINTSVEASINFKSGSFRWSIAPQYRYQLLSSFKNKYPIKENLYDMGLKFGVIKTIR